MQTGINTQWLPCLWFDKINYSGEPALRLAIICSTSTAALLGCHVLIAPNSWFSLLAVCSSVYMPRVFHRIPLQPGLCLLCITVSFAVFFFSVFFFFLKFFIHYYCYHQETADKADFCLLYSFSLKKNEEICQIKLGNKTYLGETVIFLWKLTAMFYVSLGSRC